MWEDDAIDRVKAYISRDGKTSIQCSNCNSFHAFDVSKSDLSKGRNVRYRCNCNHVQYAELERRLNYRKPVNLVGEYRWDDKPGNIRILDISATGIRFQPGIMEWFQARERLGQASIIELDFFLNDSRRSHIEYPAEVVRIGDNEIAATFSMGYPQYDKALGFYLMAAPR